jgi:hypothetical protein
MYIKKKLGLIFVRLQCILQLRGGDSPNLVQSSALHIIIIIV